MDALNPAAFVLPTAGSDPGALAATGHSRDPRAIETAAKGFESLFTTMLLKQMRGSLEPGGLFGEDPSDILGGMFDQFMGEHLAQAGGIGIGAMVRQQLLREARP